MTTRYAEIINQLIDASYETGYYSGKREDGQEHHLVAVGRRGYRKEELLGVCNKLVEACRDALEDGEEYRLSEIVKRQLRTALESAGVTP